MEWAAIVVAEPGNVAYVFAKDVECQKPSGLRPEGCCHSMSSWLGVRWHAEWQNVDTCVPFSLHENGLLTSLLVRALGLDVTEGTHYHRDAVDGLPIGNRYRTACLGKIGADSQTYAT